MIHFYPFPTRSRDWWNPIFETNHLLVGSAAIKRSKLKNKIQTQNIFKKIPYFILKRKIKSPIKRLDLKVKILTRTIITCLCVMNYQTKENPCSGYLIARGSYRLPHWHSFLDWDFLSSLNCHWKKKKNKIALSD